MHKHIHIHRHKDEVMVLQMLLGGSHETGRNSMKYTPIIDFFCFQVAKFIIKYVGYTNPGETPLNQGVYI